LTGIERYQNQVLTCLQQHSNAALAVLERLDVCLPEKTRKIDVIVHLPQDPDGTFTVMVHLDGPDLFVLNKAIAECRLLFSTVFLDGKMQPDLPLFDPFDLPFSVNDAIADAAAIWVSALWRAVLQHPTMGRISALPALVVGEDGHGTQGVINLKS
jgi:hypothetical protein